jgi:hypothetical protein
VKASPNSSPKEKSPSRQIDDIINAPGDWRGKKLSQLRSLIKKADPDVVEEVKWKKPSKPMRFLSIEMRQIIFPLSHHFLG